MTWERTNKGDQAVRELVDRHYSRRAVGATPAGHGRAGKVVFQAPAVAS